tara:strand:- start:443 stop:1048 length:606 start_codon:yes stop_codon:yes gene_type:complete
MKKVSLSISRGRIQLLSIIALFSLAPISAIFVWQYLGEHGVGSTTNHGTLVEPARPLQFNDITLTDDSVVSKRQLNGSWLYVISGIEGCMDNCKKQLYVTRQTRIAVSKDMPRVKRLLLMNSKPNKALSKMLEKDHPDLLVATLVPDKILSRFKGPDFDLRGNQYFLVDPLGNLMMFYNTNSVPRGVLKDLQKLLKISQVG